MNSFVKRLGSALTASAMMLTAGIFVPVQAADTGADAAPLFTAEAEDCTLLTGASVTTMCTARSIRATAEMVSYGQGTPAA